jgi:sulfate adenylyltransferase subunit 1 (EFTu-like GTPase family)
MTEQNKDNKQLPEGWKFNKGVLRNEKGSIIKGSTSPTKVCKTSRTKRLQIIDDFMHRKFGDGAEKLLQQICDLAMYDKEEVKKLFTPAQCIKARETLFQYYFGKAPESIQIDKQVNVNVEQRVAQITKLIGQNQDKLKVINGGSVITHELSNEISCINDEINEEIDDD